MSLLARFTHVANNYGKATALGANPFKVRMEKVISPTEAIVNGRQTTLAGTHNYLGLTFDADCIEAAIAALRQEGTGTTGSRVANGSYSHHRGLEDELAEFFGRRHAMVFSTGYQANLGMLSALVGPDDHLVIDADCHASIYDGCKLAGAKVTRFRHNDPADLEKRLRRLAAEGGNKLIVIEGIYSMLGDEAPLREIVEVKKKYGAYLLVDEAHSVGVLGERGRGLAEAAGCEADVDFVVGTFSKSFGSVGGFCVSDMEGFDLLRVASRPYTFTASLPPSVMASVRAALKALQERPELRRKLHDNAALLYGELSRSGFTLGPVVNPIVAVRLEDPETAIRFWNGLLERGVYVNLALPPATPNGWSMLRVSVSAAHSAKQLMHIAAVFRDVAYDLGILEMPVRAAAF
ncbi:MAG: aminotransferase class I/II-fold pyridoxal phosphate-dependent enzyme [Alphaproteobacteria bacterium]|nr:aminotransferase class I/II-fold pyridoxal phosphate-dependent enzyme [Alphaproteobacteria bacterium]